MALYHARRYAQQHSVPLQRAAMMLDHYDWLGFQVHHFNLGRAVGCGLMTCGILLIAKF